LGGSDDPLNLTYLTAREHFICHQLLVKAVRHEHIGKMLASCRAMLLFSTIKNRAIFRSRKYEIAKHKLGQATIDYNKTLTPEQRVERYKHNKRASEAATAKLAAMTEIERAIYYAKRAGKYRATITSTDYVQPPQPKQAKEGKKSYFDPATLEQAYFEEGDQSDGWQPGRPSMRGKPRKVYITKGQPQMIAVCRLRDRKGMSIASFNRWP
jgi:hypothetical protein